VDGGVDAVFLKKDYAMAVGKGSPDLVLQEEDVASIIRKGIPAGLYKNKRVLVLTPDTTRTCPLPMMVRAIRKTVGERCARIDFMVALGTHTPLSQPSILTLCGVSDPLQSFPRSAFYNHEWDRPETFRCIGTLSSAEIDSISGGLLSEEVPIEINKRIFDYDLVIVAGPVFPHEVVGYSGGAKYLFPGISGGEFLHFFHWLGAVISCKKIIGIKDTPVRRMIDRALDMVKVPVLCLAMVVNHGAGLCGLYAGNTREAWSQAADLSSRIHIVTKPNPFNLVLGAAPAMYDEIWTAGKVMYKLEQVVADQGTLIIYAPHIREVSWTWGRYIEAVGYHIREYLLAHMERLKDVPRGVLAHLTHVRGTGTYAGGVEKPAVNLIFATSIPEDVCRRINVGYLDPRHIHLEDYMNREAQGILLVDPAGEVLYRVMGQAADKE
jgi:nickel-dependent lactate racemase